MNPLQIIQLAIQFGPAIKSIIDVADSNGAILTKIEQLSKPLATILESVGAEFFPKAAPALHVVGAVLAAFDPDTTKWLQGSLNTILGLNLDVDGEYGPMTRDAVSALQTKLGLTVDGIAGQITQAAIQAMLAKLPKLAA